MTSSYAAAPISVQDDVKEYYGKTLTKTEDLATDICPLSEKAMRKDVRAARREVHKEVTSKYYGCGLVIPEILHNMHVLDLGSGSGHDCYILSRLVGENGHVTGLDMTEEQLKVARDYIGYHTEKFGYKEPNVEFVQGYIEKLGDAGLKDNTFDIIVSNCVVNLSHDKRAVLSEAYRVLKTGGELYFSDIYADVDLPDEIRKHKVLWGECVSGALWWEDLYKLAEEIGFSRPRLVTSTNFKIERGDLQKAVGDAKFVSATHRLFKLPEQRKPACQISYNGQIPEHEKSFQFDHTVHVKTHEVYTADIELATILHSSRYSKVFDLQSLEGQTDKVKDSGAKMDPFAFAAKTPAPPSGCCS